MSSTLSGPRFEKPVERRDFLGLASLWTFCGSVVAAIVGALKLPIPAVFPETASRFPIGKPEEFPAGTPVHLPRRRLWIIPDEQGIRAVSTVCPHLGCVVTLEEDGNFTCPCHGSRFDSAGQVLGGPSPRGLEWVELSIGPDGRLIVDSKRQVSPDTRFTI